MASAVEEPLHHRRPSHAKKEVLLRLHHGKPIRHAVHRHDQHPLQTSLRTQVSLREGFTAKYEVNRLLYCESYDDVHTAIAREKQLKGWRRDRKIALFERVNPQWLDLAKDWYPEMKQIGNRGASTAPELTLRESSGSAQHDSGESEAKITSAPLHLTSKTNPTK